MIAEYRISYTIINCVCMYTVNNQERLQRQFNLVASRKMKYLGIKLRRGIYNYTQKKVQDTIERNYLGTHSMLCQLENNIIKMAVLSKLIYLDLMQSAKSTSFYFSKWQADFKSQELHVTQNSQRNLENKEQGGDYEYCG